MITYYRVYDCDHCGRNEEIANTQELPDGWYFISMNKRLQEPDVEHLLCSICFFHLEGWLHHGEPLDLLEESRDPDAPALTAAEEDDPSYQGRAAQ